MLSIVLYATIFLLAVICLDELLENKHFGKIPGPDGLFLLHNTLDVLIEPVKLFYYFRNLANKYKRLYKLRVGRKKVVVIQHPEDVEMVIGGSKNNTKGFVYDFIEPWLKDGLLISKGEKWQHRRKMLSPAFHFNVLQNFKPVIEESCKALVDELQERVDKPQTKISTYVNDFALNAICETAMGIKLVEATGKFGRVYRESIHKLGQYGVYRTQRIWMYPNFIFRLTNIGRKQSEMLRIIKSFRNEVIAKRRELKKEFPFTLEPIIDVNEDNVLTPNKKKMALLDILLEAEKDGTIDAEGVGEEVDTFIFGGHDTSAIALQFALMLIANNQEAQENIVDECNDIFCGSDRSATLVDLAKMKYLEYCIKECLRLYPPAPIITRTIQHPVKLSQKFAMMELKMALAAILRRYRVLPVTTPQDIVYVIDYVLRVKDPICVQFENRHPV